MPVILLYHFKNIDHFPRVNNRGVDVDDFYDQTLTSGTQQLKTVTFDSCSVAILCGRQSQVADGHLGWA